MNDERLEAVCACLRRLSQTGKVSRSRYDAARDEGLPSYNALRKAGHAFTGLMERAGLEPNKPGGMTKDWRAAEEAEEAAIMAANRALDREYGEGLAVLESSVREEVRAVLLPGGVVAQKVYRIASLR